MRMTADFDLFSLSPLVLHHSSIIANFDIISFNVPVSMMSSAYAKVVVTAPFFGSLV